MDQPIAAAFSHVSMQFPDTLALDDVSLEIRKGEVFALVGENGAGKSTLVNILYGLRKPTLGELTVRGQQIGRGYTTRQAMALGVGMVHQHFMLVNSLTVAQNICLGREKRRGRFFVDEKAQREAVRALGEEYGLVVNPEDRVGSLPVGLQQRVEILKALYRGAELLILDEPTAVLTPQETEELFAVIRRVVRDKGMTVLLITHRLPEVMAVSDRVGVMRRGKLVGVVATADTDERALAGMMVGRDVIFDELRGAKQRGERALSVENLVVSDDRGLPAVRDLSLAVYRGEILGVCGVEGNGQSELAEAIAGLRAPVRGRVRIMGEDAARRTPGEVRAMGLSFVPEDRMETGSARQATLWENLLLGKQRDVEFRALGVHLRKRRAYGHARKLMEEFDIRAGGPDSLAGELSGGNLQKVVIAREFGFHTPVLLICQPTRGVDVGAIEFIHEQIMRRRNAGCAILLISADMDELTRLSDRIVTIYEGRLTGEFHAPDYDPGTLGYYMTGARGEEVGL